MTTRQQVRISSEKCPECKKPQVETVDGTERWCIDGVGHELERKLRLRPAPAERRDGRD